MVCFVNVQSVDRIIYSMFQASTWNGKTAPSESLHKQLDVTPTRLDNCIPRRASGVCYRSVENCKRKLRVEGYPLDSGSPNG